MARDPVKIWDLKLKSGGGGFMETFVRKVWLVGLGLGLIMFGVKIGNGDLRRSIWSVVGYGDWSLSLSLGFILVG